MNHFESLKTFLQQMVLLRTTQHSSDNYDFKYICYEDFILQRGLEYIAQPLPGYIEPGLERQCYYNCQRLVYIHKHLAYAEGYAVHSKVALPVFHAWIVDKQGYAYDPTWECEGAAYLGIVFSTQWLKEFMKARKQRGWGNELAVIESNYLERYSLLKTEMFFELPS